MYRLDLVNGATDDGIRRVVSILRKGGVGVIPTDTVYGIVALASDPVAVRKVLTIKKRPLDRPLPVLVSSVGEAARYAQLGTEARRLLERFWPGQLTAVLQAIPGVEIPAGIRGDGTIGLRVPDDRLCLQLTGEAGPIVAPSANPPGEPAPRSVAMVDGTVLEKVDFVIDGGDCRVGTASTVISLVDRITVLREGAVPAALIEEFYNFSGGR